MLLEEKALAAPKEIADLVERFERNVKSYKSGHYNETQLRLEFVNPFFKALGWDVDNEQGFAEAYKDVIHEDAIRIGSTTKAPDYSFRIGGQRMPAKRIMEQLLSRMTLVIIKDIIKLIQRYKSY